MAKKPMERELCLPCVHKLKAAYEVQKLSGGADHKITCAECGRRRYGGVYRVTKREVEG